MYVQQLLRYSHYMYMYIHGQIYMHCISSIHGQIYMHCTCRTGATAVGGTGWRVVAGGTGGAGGGTGGARGGKRENNGISLNT